MKRLMLWLTFLYPGAWRERYGGELRQLIEDRPLRWIDIADVMKGAAVMQFRYLTKHGLFRGAAYFAVAGAMLAAAALTVWPRTYRSVEALVPNSAPPSSGQLVRAAQRALSSPALTQIIVEQRVYGASPARTMDELLDDMRRRVRIAMYPPDAAGLHISFDHSDPAMAQTVAHALGQRFASAPDLSLTVVQPAELPVKPISPAPIPVLIAGAAAGSLTGLLLSLISRRSRPPAVV